MKRAFLIAALLALIAGGSAPAKPFHSLLGIVDEGGNARLAVIDPKTLGVTDGPSLTLGKPGGSWGFSRDRSHFVYTDGSRLRFFDLFRFAPEAGVQLAGGGPVAWLDGLTVAVLSRAGTNAVEIVKVDAIDHAVRSRRRVAGVVLATRTLPNALVALLGRRDRIAPVRLLVVEPDRTRIVPLGGVWGGVVFPRGNRPPVFTMRTPALALDEAKHTAYVVDPDGMIVELPLSTLKPTFRDVSGRLAKVVYSSVRTALALGDGLLAVTGEELSPAGRRPAGLELIDTQTWSSRLVELGATNAWVAGDGLLVTGLRSDANAQKLTSIGLVMLDRTGHARFRLFEGMIVGVTTIIGSQAYVAILGAPAAVAVDLVTGRVVGQRSWPVPTLLLGRSSSD
jgi:hypothetical protein